jgi:NagD protein
LKALLCDIDGVILRDEQLIPGAREFVDRLLASGRPFLFLTNYPSQTPADLRERLLQAGMDVPPERFYTSAMATAQFLKDQTGSRRKAFVVGEGALVHVLYEAGFTLTDSDPDFVVLGETRSFNFDMIQRAARLIRDGARFVATNPDVAGPQGRPSCGAFAAPIERMTGKSPFYVGKPSGFMMRAALWQLQAHSEDTWIVGDNMETDIIAGIQTGMETVLVLTGVSRVEDLPRYAYRPHYILPGVGELLDLMERSGR